MKVLKYPSLTFIGNTSEPLNDIDSLKALIKSLLVGWYRNGHRMILTGTREGYERLVMECAAELIEEYECPGFYLTLLNCDPILKKFIPKAATYVNYLDYYLPPDNTELLTAFLIASTSLLFVYSDPKDPDTITQSLQRAANGTSIPICNLFGLLEDKILF